MRYWDASAIVPLVVDEQSSSLLLDLLRRDRHMVTWWGTVVECASAIAARHRRGQFGVDDHDAALRLLLQASGRWRTIEPQDGLRFEAMTLLRLHRLRTGDALQLAAALDWADRRPSGLGFVCLDGRLRDAAAAQGFRVLPA